MEIGAGTTWRRVGEEVGVFGRQKKWGDGWGDIGASAEMQKDMNIVNVFGVEWWL